MRYDSLPNSKKQQSDSQRGWCKSCFPITPVLLFLPASKTCLNNLVSHSVTSWSRSGYHISFERGDPGLPKDTKILIFLINRCSLSQVQNTSFQHGFLVCWPQPTSSTLWPVIQSNIAREHAIVSQMKDFIKAFHLNPNNQKFLV